MFTHFIYESGDEETAHIVCGDNVKKIKITKDEKTFTIQLDNKEIKKDTNYKMVLIPEM